MKDNLSIPYIGKAPSGYDPRYQDMVNRAITLFFTELISRGTISVSGFKAFNLPTSSSGLAVGSVYTVNGAVHVVSDIAVFAVSGSSATASVGTVTVLTP